MKRTIKQVLTNIFNRDKPKKKVKVKVMPLDPETNTYDSLVDNNYNAYQTEKDSEGKHERKVVDVKIELNKLNQNSFEIHFYNQAFSSEFLPLILEIAALKDKIKSASFPDQKEQAQINYDVATALLESYRKNFVHKAPNSFLAESKVMDRSMRGKELTADTISDLEQYFKLEWTHRKSLCYQDVIRHLKDLEIKLRGELDKMKIIMKKDPLLANPAEGSKDEGRVPIMKF